MFASFVLYGYCELYANIYCFDSKVFKWGTVFLSLGCVGESLRIPEEKNGTNVF